MTIQISLQNQDRSLFIDDIFSLFSADIGFDQDLFGHDCGQAFIVILDFHILQTAAAQLIFQLGTELVDLLRLGAVCAVQLERQTDHYRITVIFVDVIQDFAGILLDAYTLNGRHAVGDDPHFVAYGNTYCFITYIQTEFFHDPSH